MQRPRRDASPRALTGSADAPRRPQLRAPQVHRWRAYGQSKLANLLFTLELQRRLDAAGSPVLANAAHPGYASTNLQFHTGSGLMDRLSVKTIGNRLLAQDADDAARCRRCTRRPPTCRATPTRARAAPWSSAGHPKLVGRNAAAQNTEVARRLWEVSERLTGVDAGSPAPTTTTA